MQVSAMDASGEHPGVALDDELNQETAKAVEQSQQALAEIRSRLDVVLAQMAATAEAAIGQRLEGEDGEISLKLTDLLASSQRRILDLLRRQEAALGTFNIVLFGRTGAGKSSLITAFARTDGSAVSPGESDWTADVEPLAWHACRIYDTPGINGWGRGNTRDALETRAREAVEVADFVLVCFDSQSQQVDEFAKFAAWVNQYRKPVIAVLNPRNAMWRMPSRMPVGTARANLSRAVSEHASNIRDELARLGLHSVPVVAISSKRAVFARASLPYLGPDEETLVKHRRDHGCEKLETWSNYGRLEDLLIRAVTEGAVELRIGALNDQVRGVFAGVLHSITELGEEARVAADTLEHSLIEPALRLVGYPSEEESDRRAVMHAEGVDLLAALEDARGGRFQAAVQGQYADQVILRMEPVIGALREASLREADQCIHEAFELGKALDEAELSKRCFDEETITLEIQAVYGSARAFLEASAQLMLDDARLELAIQMEGCAVDGASGGGWKYSAWGLKGAGLLSSAVGALGGVAAINFWNPLGWTAGVAAGVILAGGVLSLLFGWGGSAARKKAERTHLESRQKAAAELGRHIRQTYEGIRRDALAHLDTMVIQTTHSLLLPPVRIVLSLRRIASACRGLEVVLTEQVQDTADNHNPQSLIWEVAKRCEQKEFPQDPNASALYWLGEDWIENPEGLKCVRGSTSSGPTRAYDPGFFDKLFSGMRGFLDRFSQGVTLNAAQRWLAEAQALAVKDPGGKAALLPLQGLSDAGKPKIHLLGDYNTGKSSFIKRLLLDAGSQVPDNLKVGARPMTDTVQTYDWKGVQLVDSPGFQSGNALHTEQAWAALADASAVIFLLQPNLILGDDMPLRTVIHGDLAKGIVSKRDATYFIVNRSDELGADPEVAPSVYMQLVGRKREELRQALASRDVQDVDERIFFMASDPYGLVGDRDDVDAAAFDRFRAWDGFAPFMESLHAVRRDLLASGVARSILQGGVFRLTKHTQAIQHNIERQHRQIRQLEQLRHAVEKCAAEGELIGDRYVRKLRGLLHDYAQGLKQALLAELDPSMLKHRAEQLQKWWSHDEVEQLLKDWQDELREALEAWQRSSAEQLERKMESVAFRHASLGPQRAVGGIDDASGKGLGLQVLDKVGRAFGGANRDVVYKIGKSLGVNFRPWGAVNLAKSITKVGAVIGVVGVVADAAFIYIDEKRHGEREGARQKLAAFVDESEKALIEAMTEGSGDEPGLLQGKDALVASFNTVAGELAQQYALLQYAAAAEEGLISTYRGHCQKAVALLDIQGDDRE